MEQRDKLMTKLKLAVEYLYAVNGERIAFVAHSAGCKLGQYFLHWMEQIEGRQWIDKHLQTLIAVGPPWLGAPKAIRTILAGDSLGLPTSVVLGNRCMAALFRSFSSSLWMAPFGEIEECCYYRVGKETVQRHWNSVLSEEHQVRFCD